MSDRKPKVGIVIVAYNSSDAVHVTLASIVNAKSNVAVKLILVDNGSKAPESERIQDSFRRYSGNSGDEWIFLRSDENLGFSDGNNLGINALLRDTSVSHICLLNSDVIVTDFWIDRLVNKNVPAVSPVTNKAESEQCVPVDYELVLGDVLGGSRSVDISAFERVNSFAQTRSAELEGNLVLSPDLTFFCVVLSRGLVEKVGLLDARFFPGGYEDYDYCLRAAAEGFSLHLARDVFIHHWGSASFSQLDRDYFQSHSEKNRRYLEGKHAISWKIRPQKAFSSYRQDLVYLLGRGDKDSIGKNNERFQSGLLPLVRHFASEHELLTGAARRIIGCPDDVRLFYNELPDKTLVALWQKLLKNIDTIYFQPAVTQEHIVCIEEFLLEFEVDVFDTVQKNIALSGWLSSTAQMNQIINSRSWKLTAPLRKIMRLIRKKCNKTM